MLNKLAAFFADGIGHNNFCLISANGCHKRKSYSLIAAGRLNYDGFGLDDALLFRVNYHVICRTGLDGAAYVQTLKLDEDLGAVEEEVYGDCDCCDDDCIEAVCPACDAEICIEFDDIDEDGKVECPACGEILEFEIEEEIASAIKEGLEIAETF